MLEFIKIVSLFVVEFAIQSPVWFTFFALLTLGECSVHIYFARKR